MGTYFADKEQISRLRMKNRVVAPDLIRTHCLSTNAADLALSSSDEKVTGQ